MEVKGPFSSLSLSSLSLSSPSPSPTSSFASVSTPSSSVSPPTSQSQRLTNSTRHKTKNVSGGEEKAQVSKKKKNEEVA